MKRKIEIKQNIKLFLYVLPGILFVLIMAYLPLWGWSYAFVQYKPWKSVGSL